MHRWTLCFGYCSASGAVALVLSGCPEGGRLDLPECEVVDCGPPTDGPAEVLCDPTPIFADRCGTGLCHGGGSPGNPPPGGADLFAGTDAVTLGEALLNQPATYPTDFTDACPKGAPELLINSADPAASLILTKVQGGMAFACGEPMPTGTPLTAAQIDCIDQWIRFTIQNAAAGD